MRYDVKINYSGAELYLIEANSFAEAEEKAREIFWENYDQDVDSVEVYEHEQEFEKRDE